MAIPTPKQLSRPILEIVKEKEEGIDKKSILESLIERFPSLTEDELQERHQSGSPKFDTNVRGVLSDLKRAGLLLSPSRAHYQITEKGKTSLASHTGDIPIERARPKKEKTVAKDNMAPPNTAANDEVGTASEDSAPDEQIAVLYQKLSDRLAEELLERVKRVSPADFERLVVSLLEKMGYGQGQAIGGSGDGGIDGIINQDALGLEKVYIQAKRWESQVGEPEIRNFSGSLEAKGANKGVFITSSSFGPKARETARFISAGNKFIRLIDGEELARLMINHGVGVVSEIIYDVKKLDENYFAEDL
jgi:restriction system protein